MGTFPLSWTPDVYRLTLTVWLDVRASALFERRLQDALASFEELADSQADFEFRGGAINRDECGTTAEPATLTIVADRTLFAIAPEQLREIGRRMPLRSRRAATARRGGNRMAQPLAQAG
ncbi:MAG: hypothetical protein LT070_06595 [Solirubrobacteraceae bacterium]|nr:hypothetical protein [Solirubrobacteraceae bacterium]